MKHRKLNMLALIVFLVSGLNASAQEGPFVPCTDCASRTNSTFPASGPWANTDQTGSGFSLQIQNGILAGFYYGYDAQGRPEWLLFSGVLQPGDPDSQIQWQLEASLSRFSGGSCPACAYTAPTSQDSVGTIKVKFFQRNHASFQFDSEPEQFMVPLLYGSAGRSHFSEHTDYLVPELGGDDENASPWLISYYEGTPPKRNTNKSVILHFESSVVTISEASGQTVEYNSIESLCICSPAEPAVTIICADSSGSGDIECEVRILLANYSNAFKMPLANLGANRFFGENENGDTVEGFRIFYD